MAETGGASNIKRVFVLFGKKGAGKSTIASALSRIYKDSTRKSFAYRLKRGLSAMLDIPMKDLSDPEKKESSEHTVMGKTYRELMQTLGTEWGRECVDRSLWAYLLAKDTVECIEETVIVDDGRLPQEREEFEQFLRLLLPAHKELEYHTIYVNRPTLRDDGTFSKHSSETSMPVSTFPRKQVFNNRSPTTRGITKAVRTFLKFKLGIDTDALS